MPLNYPVSEKLGVSKELHALLVKQLVFATVFTNYPKPLGFGQIHKEASKVKLPAVVGEGSERLRDFACKDAALDLVEAGSLLLTDERDLAFSPVARGLLESRQDSIRRELSAALDAGVVPFVGFCEPTEPAGKPLRYRSYLQPEAAARGVIFFETLLKGQAKFVGVSDLIVKA